MWIVLLQVFISSLRSRESLVLENVALRHQLLVLHRTASRPRLRRTDRIFWVWLSRLWSNWRDDLVLVRPETVVRWHREGFRLYWRRRSQAKPGRPALSKDVRDLIQRMSTANPLWGAPRIHGELLKLGIEVSQSVISKYLVRRRPRPSQTWRTFLANSVGDIVSIDFLMAPTATFRVLFVLLVLRHGRRRIVHFDVTDHPTTSWTGQQIVEGFPWRATPKYLLRDRDGAYGMAFRERVRGLGIEELLTQPCSPWQNAFVERMIGSIRRECLDHVIVFDERQLRRVLREYLR